MKLPFSILVVLVAVGSYAVPPPMRQSKQFTVVDARPTTVAAPGTLKSTVGRNLIRLDADVLLLSAERVKETLLWELGISPEGAGRIRMFLRFATRPDELIRVMSSREPGGWEYRVEVPDQVDPDRLIRGVVDVLLLEIANRGQGPKSAELPVWMVEGLSRHVSAVAGPDLVLGSVPIGKMLRMVRERKGLDYLESARAVLQANSPLSYNELAYPTAHHLTGTNLLTYQCSAQLFVQELLHSKNGPRNFVAMLRELPRCWNWEIALLRGFEGEYTRMLDVEKMWSVSILAFRARDPSQVWSQVACLNRLDEIVTIPAQVRLNANELPERRTLTLQQIIADPDLARQSGVIRQRLAQLAALRVKAPPTMAPLIDAYTKTLATYLQNRALAGRSPETRMQPVLSASLVAQEAIRDLETLDKRRKEMHPEQALSVNSPTNSSR